MVLRSTDLYDDWPREVPRPPSRAELWQEDEPLESDRHVSQVNLLRDSAQHHFRDRPDVFVGGNMPVYFSALQVRNRDFRAPDFFAVFGTRPGPRDFWIVWEEEKGPDVVIEILSDSTEQVDRGRKKQIYEQLLRVSEYYLFGFDPGRVEGYRLDPKLGYVEIPPNAAGRLQSYRLGFELGVVHATIHQHEGAWLRFFEPDGSLVPTAAEAEARRAEAEARRAEAEARRAEAEAQRAGAEARRADELRAKLAAYEAKFGPLDG